MLLTTILELGQYSSVLERDSSFRFRCQILFLQLVGFNESRTAHGSEFGIQ